MNRKGEVGTRHAAKRVRLAGMILFMLGWVLISSVSGEVPIATILVTAPAVAVTTDPGPNLNPRVDGNLVTYTNGVTGGFDIHYFNFATNADLAIPAPGAPPYDIVSEVSGSTIVFTRAELGLPTLYSIWSFNTATGGPAIELAPAANSQRLKARIGGNTVAWEDWSFVPVVGAGAGFRRSSPTTWSRACRYGSPMTC